VLTSHPCGFAKLGNDVGPLSVQARVGLECDAVARLAGRDEDLKQIAAMHQSIGIAESLDEGIADRRLIDNSSRQHVAENETLGICSNLLYCFENANRIEVP
jgi:hypothetical protein